MVKKKKNSGRVFVFQKKKMSLYVQIQLRSDIYKAENCTQPTDINTDSDQTVLSSSHQEALSTG